MSWCSIPGIDTQNANGEGRLFFPPPNWNKNPDEFILDDPIESVRLEILRDGLEDWEYFTTLKEISTSKDATSEQKGIARKLLEIPDNIVGDTEKIYVITPEKVLKKRNEIGKFMNAYFCGEEYSYSFSISEGEDASSFVSPISFLMMVLVLLVAIVSHHY